ncbi:unnamed protein product [Callosobruchus maculatus]
MPFSN